MWRRYCGQSRPEQPSKRRCRRAGRCDLWRARGPRPAPRPRAGRRWRGVTCWTPDRRVGADRGYRWAPTSVDYSRQSSIQGHDRWVQVAKFRQLTPGLGRGLGVAEPSGHSDQDVEVVGHVIPIGRVRGIGGQGLPLPLDGLAEPDAGLLESFRLHVDDRDVIEDSAQIAREIGRLGILLRQLLPDRQGRLEGFYRLGRLPGVCAAGARCRSGCEPGGSGNW